MKKLIASFITAAAFMQYAYATTITERDKKVFREHPEILNFLLERPDTDKRIIINKRCYIASCASEPEKNQ